jgi:serine/threonine protein kinase
VEEARASGELIAGKYRVRRMIGQGGMGRVVEAVHEAVGKPVALKWIHDERAEGATGRVHREARAAARVHHANVVDIYDVIEHDGATCIVMELVSGEPLHSVLARRGRLDVIEAVAISVEIARGIAAAHRAGVVHRDLKPSNLIVREPGAGVRVTVVDFGISRLDSRDDGATTGSGARFAGTPQYMAPEQVRAEHVDARADVYAMGAVLYEMLTGRPPHVNEHVSALLVEIATVAPTPAHVAAPDVPVALSDVVGRALAKRPEDRYADAEAFERALSPFLSRVLDAPTLERAPTSGVRPIDAPTIGPDDPVPAPSSHRPRARWRVAVGAAAAIVLALAASAVAAAKLSSGEPRDLTPAPIAAPPQAAPEPLLAAQAPEDPAIDVVIERAVDGKPPRAARRTMARQEPLAPEIRRARGVRTRGISSDEF